MSYTSILVHVDHSSHAHARMTAAAQLAVDQNAHLLVNAVLDAIRDKLLHAASLVGVQPVLHRHEVLA